MGSNTSVSQYVNSGWARVDQGGGGRGQSPISRRASALCGINTVHRCNCTGGLGPGGARRRRGVASTWPGGTLAILATLVHVPTSTCLMLAGIRKGKPLAQRVKPSSAPELSMEIARMGHQSTRQRLPHILPSRATLHIPLATYPLRTGACQLGLCLPAARNLLRVPIWGARQTFDTRRD